ncbi:MAG: helix-turn-helix domain-containing protein [Streptosporangiaceae bacterium]
MPAYSDDARPAHPSPASAQRPDRLLYRVEEVAELLAVSRCKVYQLISTGDIASLKLGGSRRITADALADFVARLEAAGRVGAA